MARAGIAIVTHNTRRFWARQRAALEAQTVRAFRALIVDNASQAAERIAADEVPAWAELVQLDRNIGFAAANNLAAARLDAPYFVTLNPDAFPAPDWLARLIGAADAEPSAGAIGSLQVLDRDPGLIDGAGDAFWIGGIAWRALHGKPMRPLAALAPCFSACAAAALYRRDAFQQAGGFDEDFFCYHEDVDLGFRLRLAGWRALQANEAVVVHVGGGAAGARSDFAIEHGARNRLWTFLKNQPAALLWWTAPLHMLATLLLLAAHAARGELRPFLAGLGSGLRGSGRALAKRAAIQARRRAPAAALLAAMNWSPLALLRRAPAPARGANLPAAQL